MSSAAQLYRLQQLDLELQKKHKELAEVENQLSNNEMLTAAQCKLASQKEQLQEARKKQKYCEWELEDLQERIRQIDGKLYSGKTKDPKELVNLERELKALKSQVRTKEDALLASMSQVEELEARTKNTAEEVERLRRDWEQRQETLRPRKVEVETTLGRLRADRDELARRIDLPALDIYERIVVARGQAVVKVEGGRCLGCHITVPTSQWQRARAGDLIQCSNCSRILYLE